MGISPDEGRQAFDRILANTWGQLVVSPPDFLALSAVMQKRRNVASGGGQEKGAGTPAAPKAAHARPALASVYVAPGTPAERKMCEIWQGMLGLDRVGIHDNFFDLGGHSLMATQLVARLRADFAVELTVAMLFESPTVAALSVRMGGEPESPVEAMSGSTSRGQRRKERRLERRVGAGGDDVGNG